jgi:ribosome-binding protein aMBF1 (putative translation factor)
MSSAREHLAAQLDGIPRKSLTMRGESVSRRGEGDPQPLVEDLKRAIGRAIEEAIKAAKLEKKDVAERMGYSDQSVVGRWIAGVETPQFAKLFLIEELRLPLVVALAALSKDAEIVTTISFRRSA